MRTRVETVVERNDHFEASGGDPLVIRLVDDDSVTPIVVLFLPPDDGDAAEKLDELEAAIGTIRQRMTAAAVA